MARSLCIILTFGLLDASALADDVSNGGGNPHEAIGGYIPVSNVIEQSQIAYDIKVITNAVHHKDFALAKEIYTQGGYSCMASATGSSNIKLRDFVRESTAEMLVGQAFFDSFTNGTGPNESLGPIPGEGRLALPLDFWDRYIMDALDETGDFLGKSGTARMVAIKKGILGVVVMHVASLLGQAVDLADQGNTGDATGAPHLWDSAWAFYYGACGDSCPVECVTPGWCRFSSWEAVLKRDVDHAYSRSGRRGRIEGAVLASEAVTSYFRKGQMVSRTPTFNKEEMIKTRDNIYRIIALTAIRAMLRYSYTINRGNALKYYSLNELLHMQAFSYFQAAAGWIEQASPGTARTVMDYIDFRKRTGDLPQSLFCDIQAALIPAYSRLGIDCAMISMDYSIPSNFSCPNLPSCATAAALDEGMSEYESSHVTTEAGSNVDCRLPLAEFDTSSTTSTSTTPLSPAIFEAVDGGMDRACRGEDIQDNAASYFEEHGQVGVIENCKALCQLAEGCVGIEFAASIDGGRCEVWIRSEGIQASTEAADFQCFRLIHSFREPTDGAPRFEEVDGGIDRACRGTDANDNAASYYTVESGVASLDACKKLCFQNVDCKGLEFNAATEGGRCEVWTRADGIEASVALVGFTCLRVTTDGAQGFEEVDSGIDRATTTTITHTSTTTYITIYTSTTTLTTTATSTTMTYYVAPGGNGDIQVRGEVAMAVNDPAAFIADTKAQDAVKHGIASRVQCPTPWVDATLTVSRRLSESSPQLRRLEGTVTATYVIRIPATKPATGLGSAVTASSVAGAIQETSTTQMKSVLETKLAEKGVTVGTYTVTVTAIQVPTVTVTTFTTTTTAGGLEYGSSALTKVAFTTAHALAVLAVGWTRA